MSLLIILSILFIFFYRKINKDRLWTSHFVLFQNLKFFHRLSGRLSRVIKEKIIDALNKYKPIVLFSMEIRMTQLAAACGDNPTKVQQDSMYSQGSHSSQPNSENASSTRKPRTANKNIERLVPEYVQHAHIRCALSLWLKSRFILSDYKVRNDYRSPFLHLHGRSSFSDGGDLLICLPPRLLRLHTSAIYRTTMKHIVSYLPDVVVHMFWIKGILIGK